MKNTTAMADYELRHIEALRKDLTGCTVLLKKDGSFPLEKPCTLAAYGSGVRRTIRGGTGSGEVNSRYSVTIEEGLQQAGFTLTGMEWHTGYEQAREKAHKAFLKQLKKDAKAAKQNFILYGMGKVMPEPEYDLPLNAEGDAAIYVVSRISGEGNDSTPLKGDIRLTGTGGLHSDIAHLADPDAGGADGLHDQGQAVPAQGAGGVQQALVLLAAQLPLLALKESALHPQGADTTVLQADETEKGVEGGQHGVDGGGAVAGADQVGLPACDCLPAHRRPRQPLQKGPCVPQVLLHCPRAPLLLRQPPGKGRQMFLGHMVIFHTETPLFFQCGTILPETGGVYPKPRGRKGGRLFNLQPNLRHRTLLFIYKV